MRTLVLKLHDNDYGNELLFMGRVILDDIGYVAVKKIMENERAHLFFSNLFRKCHSLLNLAGNACLVEYRGFDSLLEDEEKNDEYRSFKKENVNLYTKEGQDAVYEDNDSATLIVNFDKGRIFLY